jgi:pachytene checkpoint protein 2
MAAAGPPEQEEQIRFILENQIQGDSNNHEVLALQRTKERGRLYVEGKVKDDFTGNLEQVGYCSLSNISSNNSFVKVHGEIVRVFSLGIVQSLSLILWQEILKSDACRFMPIVYFKSSYWTSTVKGLFPERLLSLKAVEYVGAFTFRGLPLELLPGGNFHEYVTRELSSTYFPLKSVDLEIHVYQMSASLEHLEDDGTLLQAEIIQLPSLRIEGIWERLVFDTDIRGNLVRLMTNMRKHHSILHSILQSIQRTSLVKFSRALSTANLRSRTNCLILLSGPPGTGKTTLYQALAQKLSIRLNCNYSSTSLIQINAATLLSKFFSESAKHILQVFTAILAHCTSSPKHFTIVLIDEIESLASSRSSANNRGEVQDTIRATNALLTGFDKVKSQPNLIILCTSNMVDTLDAAFLDRCGHRIIIEEPSEAARYQILRDGIQELIAAKIVNTDQSVPSYRDAQLELLSEPKKPGSVLMKLCNFLGPSTCSQRLGIEGRGRISARYLGQLPEVALADRLITESCSLDEALQHMTKFVEGQSRLELDQIDRQRALENSEDFEEHWDLGLKRKRI